VASNDYPKTEGARMVFLGNLVNQNGGLFTIAGLTAADVMAMK